MIAVRCGGNKGVGDRDKTKMIKAFEGRKDNTVPRRGCER